MIFTLLMLLLLQNTYCDDIVSNVKENDNEPIDKTDKHTSSTDASARRFIEDLDEKEWYVAHLRDSGFLRRSECVGETEEDKLKKYRRALKEDGARVEYVMARPLPFDEKDLLNRGKCVSLNTSTQADMPNDDDHKKDDEVKTATTAKPKLTRDKTMNMTNEKSRRASEYQFSSVEYYDEITTFDDEICPDDVEVITLEMDQLRNYDIECERIVEWRSLDN